MKALANTIRLRCLDLGFRVLNIVQRKIKLIIILIRSTAILSLSNTDQGTTESISPRKRSLRVTFF